jgi:hypothetical protein
MTVTSFDTAEPRLSRASGGSAFADRSPLFERIQGRQKRSNKALIAPAIALVAGVALFGASQYASNQKHAADNAPPAPAASTPAPVAAAPMTPAPVQAVAPSVAAPAPIARVTQAPAAASVQRARAATPVVRTRPAVRAETPVAESAPLITPPTPIASAPAETAPAIVAEPAAPVMDTPASAPVN